MESNGSLNLSKQSSIFASFFNKGSLQLDEFNILLLHITSSVLVCFTEN